MAKRKVVVPQMEVLVKGQPKPTTAISVLTTIVLLLPYWRSGDGSDLIERTDAYLEIKEEASEDKSELMLSEETWKHLKSAMAIANQGINVQFEPEINDLYLRLLSKIARAERVEKPEQS